MAEITLAAVGDISFARQVESDIAEFGPSFPFEKVAADLAGADILFGNQESVMIPDDFPPGRISGRPLASRDFVLEALERPKFDVLHAASNHALDCGWRGLLHTLDCLERTGALTLGAGTDQSRARQMKVIEKNGLRIGFLGYLQAGDWTLEGGGGRLAWFKKENVVPDIRRNRALVDLLVVSVHGDIEFQPAPSVPRLELCRKIAEAGADLVLCHHPHVPQGVEKWGDCLIHYSLGNFLFSLGPYQLNSSANVTRSHIFFVEIDDGRITGWRRKYLRIDKEHGRPCPLPPGEEREEDEYYRRLDAILADPRETRKLWHESCLARLSLVLDKIRRDGEMTPGKFLRVYGRTLFSDMCREYLDGLLEIAEESYLDNALNDFEFKRPYAPYEE